MFYSRVIFFLKNKLVFATIYDEFSTQTYLVTTIFRKPFCLFTSILQTTLAITVDIILGFEKSIFVKSCLRTYSFSENTSSSSSINFLVWWLCRTETSNQLIQNLKLNIHEVPSTLFFNSVILFLFLWTV